MPILRLGEYSLRLDLPDADQALRPEDRDCAWQLVVALARRPLLLGWSPSGEVAPAEARAEVAALAACIESALARLPASAGSGPSPQAEFLLRTLAFVIGPFLDKWSERAEQSASADAFAADLARVQEFLSKAAADLARIHGLPDLVGERPPGLVAAWRLEPGA